VLWHTNELYWQNSPSLLFSALALPERFWGHDNFWHRIVFPGTQSDQTVRTNNKGNTPIVAQVWVDDGSKDDNLSNINVPFTVTPPVFRVEPGKGQSVRLIYNA
jgi:chaperone protein EcpD